MKKSLYFISILIYGLCPFTVHSQCGVEARLTIFGNNWNMPMLTTDSSLLQPNWKKYACQFSLNGDTLPTSYLFYTFNEELPIGFNEVCVRLWATDTLTGDSCSSSTCNIFQSAGQFPWVRLDVDSVGPLTYQFHAWWNTIYYFPENFLLKFGDGDSVNIYGTGFFTHTYPAPGNYNAHLSVEGFINYSGIDFTTDREVHVDNGLGNIGWLIPSVTSQCDSITLMVSSNYWTYSGNISFTRPDGMCCPFYDTPINFQASVQFKIPAFATPGVKLMQTTLHDPNGGYAYSYDGVMSDNCGIVPDTAKGKVFSDLDADGILDTNETGIAGQTIYTINYGTLSDSAGNYALLKPNEEICFNLSANSNLITIPKGSYCITQANQDYNFGIAAYTTQIKGRVYIDYNHDSLYNSGDDVFSSATIEAYNTTLLKSFYTSTNSQGNYDILVPSGNYIMRPAAYNLDSAYFFPDSIVINSPTGGIYNNNDFASNSTLTGANFNVHLTRANEPRPGFSQQLIARITNTGIDSAFGTLVLNYDADLFFDSIGPAGGSIDTINHSITWQTGFIKATRTKYFTLYCKVPALLPLGTPLLSTATVVPDASIPENDSLNNSAMLNEIVIGSVDPNDKIVSPAGNGLSGDIHHNQRLHYRVNFQNTGTASAINVIVQDVLDEDLDLSSFLMEGASHTYTIFINERTVTWKFLNIDLADSNFSEALSHGYVEFSILPMQGLPDGTPVENSASIYFDFNAPVQTNVVQNTLQTNITGIPEVASTTDFIVYPVPAAGQLTIVSSVNLHDKTEIILTDVAGRAVEIIYTGAVKKGRSINVSLEKVPQGIYFLKIKSDNLFFTKKIIKV